MIRRQHTKRLAFAALLTHPNLVIAALMMCLGAGIALPPTASAAQKCPAQGAYRIEIDSGPTSCTEAYAITAKFYTNTRDKFQQVGRFACSETNAMSRDAPDGSYHGLLLNCCVGSLRYNCADNGASFSVFERK